VLDWNAQEKGLVLSSFFWGYMILQIPAGILAKRYGPSILLVITCVITSILTLLTPVVSIYGGWIAMVVIRVMIGLAQVRPHLS
jgi:MFS family permease